MKRWFAVCLFAVFFFVGVASAQAAYKGRVVDADTKEPIEGVVVFMEWVQAHAMSGRTYVDAYETVTDEQGRFSLPGYWSLNPVKILWTDNLVTIFKSGYEPIVGGSWHDMLDGEWGSPKGSIVWKVELGKPVILLHKGGADIKKRLSSLEAISPGGPASKSQLLLREVEKEREFLFSCKANNQC